MKFSKLFLAATLLSSFSALADLPEIYYKDNKGYLYCLISCKVDDNNREHTAGLYPKHENGNYLTVRGKWKKTGYTYMHSGYYEVDATVLENAKKRCLGIKEELFHIEKIQDLINSSDITGINRNSCKINPKIKADSGLLKYDLKVAKVEEEDQTDL